MTVRPRAAFTQACAFLTCICLVGTPLTALGAPLIQAASSGKSATAQKNADKPGKVAGLVVNLATGDPIPNAGVEIVSTQQTFYTDNDGNFVLTLPPGSYEVRVFKSGFVDTKKPVTIVAGDVFPLDFALSTTGSGEVVEVNATSGSTEIAMVEERKTASTIVDSLSLREINNDVAGDAAGVLQRAPGLSIVDNKFVYVRGLGDRYSNTVMNDAVMPTPQAERKVVPLDQVPSDLIQNLKILKTFTPDQPGEFAGGLVKIETLEFPNRSSLKFSTSFGGNTQTTFQDMLTSPGDRLDFLGFGLGRRELPSIIPNKPLVRGSDLLPGFTPQELQTFGRAFENVWEPRKSTAPINQSYSLAGSTQIGKLGFIGTLTYGNSSTVTPEIQRYPRVSTGPDGTPVVSAQNLYDYVSGVNSVRLGLLGNAAYKLNDKNKFLFKNFFSNDSRDEAREFQGYFDDRTTDILNRRLRYTRTRTETHQLAGDHLISKLGDSIITWRFTYSRALLDEPDLRETLYDFNSSLGKFVFFQGGQSGFRMFTKMRENIREPAIDWSKFVFKSNITFNFKAGFQFTNRDRSFNARRLRFTARSLAGIDTSLSPENLFEASNINPEGFEVQENTRPTDFFVAKQDIIAGYGMADVTYNKFRLIFGARVENSEQQVQTFELFSSNPEPTRATLENTDVLPSIGFVYNIKPNINLRIGYSQTVTRPQFRELSPFEFTEATGGRSTLGNPNLVRTKIQNYDARFEMFQSSGRLFAVSFFYKNLRNPIEPVVEATANLRTSYRNADKAKNRGLEFEMRQTLGKLSSRLENLTLTANYTFVDSSVEIGPEALELLTSKSRPLAGQSTHLINLSLDYDIPKFRSFARVLYNYTGERISDVGALGIPDIKEKGYPALDVLFSKKLGGENGKWEVKFSGENLLNRLVRFKIGDDFPFQVYRRGRTFGAGLSYTFF